MAASLNDHVKSDIAVSTQDQKKGNHKMATKPLKEYLKNLYLSPGVMMSGNFLYNNSFSRHFRQIDKDIHSPPPKS